MKIILAKDAGYCFGVRDAVNSAYEMSKKYGEVYMLGDIVHNESVVSDLEKEGVINLSSTKQVIALKQHIRVQQVTQSGRRLIVDGHPIFNENGTLVKVINISKDVTEIADLKAKLEIANSTLEYYQEEINKVQKKWKTLT